MHGLPIANEDVIPAKNRNKNHIPPAAAPRKAPHWLNKYGIVLNPGARPQSSTNSLTLSIPKYPTAIGIIIDPPITTSTNLKATRFFTHK